MTLTSNVTLTVVIGVTITIAAAKYEKSNSHKHLSITNARNNSVQYKQILTVNLIPTQILYSPITSYFNIRQRYRSKVLRGSDQAKPYR